LSIALLFFLGQTNRIFFVATLLYLVKGPTFLNIKEDISEEFFFPKILNIRKVKNRINPDSA
jgi:hypothetical protein